jgi:hypothetical protein
LFPNWLKWFLFFFLGSGRVSGFVRVHAFYGKQLFLENIRADLRPFLTIFGTDMRAQRASAEVERLGKHKSGRCFEVA